ncbi:MAG: hypothetical protein U0704_15650 [Candidatus Eisenbacteria bacterium]
MKRMLAVFAVLVAAASLAAPCRALEVRHGLELQAGLGHWNEPNVSPEGSEYRWKPVLGAGWFVEVPAGKSVSVSASLGYRRVGDEVRWSTNVGGTDYDSKIRLDVDQLTLPVQVAWSLPFAPAFAIEAGGQGEYLLKAMEKAELAAFPAIRARRPYAVIFEDTSKPFEVTSYTNRLGGSAIAGLSWRTKLFSRDAAVAAHWEQGLTAIWKDGDDESERQARRMSAALRVNW